MKRITATEIIMLQKEKARQVSLSYSIQFLEEERERLLNDIPLRGPGLNVIDYRPLQVDDLNKAIIILKRATQEDKK